MQRDIQRVLIDRHTIARRVAELAQTITRDFDDGSETQTSRGGGVALNPKSQIPNSKFPIPPVLTLVPILTGSIIFVSDLIRHLPLRLKIRMVSVSSYPGASVTSKGAELRHQLSSLPEDLGDAKVLVIDDILDSGRTLRMVTDLIRARNPASLQTCVLLRKQVNGAPGFPVDYACFDIPDEFVVGYGLDFNDYYRNLPDIVTLRPEVLQP